MPRPYVRKRLPGRNPCLSCRDRPWCPMRRSNAPEARSAGRVLLDGEAVALAPHPRADAVRALVVVLGLAGLADVLRDQVGDEALDVCRALRAEDEVLDQGGGRDRTEGVRRGLDLVLVPRAVAVAVAESRVAHR